MARLSFHMLVEKQYQRSKSVQQSAGLPACLIGRCCSCFCSWLVLVPLFSCCAFLLRLNQGHPPLTPPVVVVVVVVAAVAAVVMKVVEVVLLLLPPLILLLLLLRLLRRLLRLRLWFLYSSTPSSLLPQVLPTLVVPVANDAAYRQHYIQWSTGTRRRTHTVLIDQYSCSMSSNGCSSTHLLIKLLLIYGSVFISSSLRLLPSVHVKPEAHT
jgi:hypothetical protein